MVHALNFSNHSLVIFSKLSSLSLVCQSLLHRQFSLAAVVAFSRAAIPAG